MLFHAKALELYTAAFQNVFSMDEEQDIEVCNFSANLALASKSTFRPTWPTSSCVAHDKKVECWLAVDSQENFIFFHIKEREYNSCYYKFSGLDTFWSLKSLPRISAAALI